MAASKPLSLQNEMEDELTCIVCMEQYNNSERRPKLLLCGHTFCRACTMQYADQHLHRTLFQCPLCKKNITIGPDGVDGLPNNLICVSILDRMKKLALTRSVEKPPCKEHGTSSDHVCLTCEEVLCSKCVLALLVLSVQHPHTGHNVVTVDEAFDRRKKVLQQWSSKMSTAYKNLATKQSAQSAKEKDFEQTVSSMIVKTKQQMAAAHKKLDHWEKNTIQQLEQASSDVKDGDHGQFLRNKIVEVQQNIIVAMNDLELGRIRSLYSGDNIDGAASRVCKNINLVTSAKLSVPTIASNVIQMSENTIKLGRIVIKRDEKAHEKEKGRTMKPLQFTSSNSSQSCSYCGKVVLKE